MIGFLGFKEKHNCWPMGIEGMLWKEQRVASGDDAFYSQ
jgi:hypothetical protein